MKEDSQRRLREKWEPPAYRRPSKRGGDGGKREILVTSVARVRTHQPSREQRVPYIRMSGKWLQRLGFKLGHRVEITAERERIVLTVVDDDRELPVN